MREEESNWFARWEEELPSPEELMPLSQSLITPNLAAAFDIPTPTTPTTPTPTPPTHPPPPPFDSDDSARTLKRPRLVWTPQLHKRFVDAVAQLGIKSAVPKTIMQLMSVDGLTRENVASHLQKYRLYLKRIKSPAAGGGGGISAADHHLFSTAAAPVPVPHHFINRDPFLAMQQQQMAAAAAAQQQYYHQMQVGRFGPGGFLAQPQMGVQRMVGVGVGMGMGMVQQPPRTEEGGGRRELTLFPTADN